MNQGSHLKNPCFVSKQCNTEEEKECETFELTLHLSQTQFSSLYFLLHHFFHQQMYKVIKFNA